MFKQTEKITMECPVCRARGKGSPASLRKTRKCPKCGTVGRWDHVEAEAPQPAPAAPEPPDVPSATKPPEPEEKKSLAALLREAQASETPMEGMAAVAGYKQPTKAKPPEVKMPSGKPPLIATEYADDEEGEEDDSYTPTRPTKDCPFCGEEILAKAKKCKHCGEFLDGNGNRDASEDKKKKEKIARGVCGCISLPFAILFCLLAIGFFFSMLVGSSQRKDSSPRDRATDSSSPEDNRKKLIEKHFSAWDGSHNELTKVIKKSMNDPDSFDHVETVYWDMGDHLIVQTTFRGKNAFGGVVKNWVKAKVGLDGKVIEIIEQGP